MQKRKWKGKLSRCTVEVSGGEETQIWKFLREESMNCLISYITGAHRSLIIIRYLHSYKKEDINQPFDWMDTAEFLISRSPRLTHYHLMNTVLLPF